MRFSHFFVDRPIFAGVISIILTLLGFISFRALPITEYPEIAPPTVVVNATFAGASAEVIAQTVAAPIEQEINGVDNMLYVVSQSTGNGALSISVVFKPGTNIDQAQVLVQNRVSVALPRLPEEVQRIGVTVRKNSPDLMLVIHLISPEGSLDQQYISNYATINIKDVITRIDGVGDTIVFGARDYSMRVWLDPAKVQAHKLTASDVVSALRAANVQVAAGSINQPPATSPGAFEIAVQTLGRLSDPDQFKEIVIATDDDGRVTRVRDIARVRAWLAGLHHQRLSRQQSGDGDRDFSKAGLKCARYFSHRARHDGRARQEFSAGNELPRRLQHDRVHSAVGRRGHQDAVRSGRARRDRDHPLPADLASGNHPYCRHPGFIDRHFLGDDGIRLLSEQSNAVRSSSSNRHCRRRRHRRGRERRTLSASGNETRAMPPTRPWTRSVGR